MRREVQLAVVHMTEAGEAPTSTFGSLPACARVFIADSFVGSLTRAVELITHKHVCLRVFVRACVCAHLFGRVCVCVSSLQLRLVAQLTDTPTHSHVKHLPSHGHVVVGGGGLNVRMGSTNGLCSSLC